MNTNCAYPQGLAGVRRQWSGCLVRCICLLILGTAGCGAPSTEHAMPAASTPAAVVAPAVIASPTSAPPSATAAAVPSSMPASHTAPAITATTSAASPDPGAVLVPTPSDTATWQRYQHDEYGLSLQYPRCFDALQPWQRPDQTSAPLVALSASVVDRSACPLARLQVQMTPLDTYRFTAPGATYAYDPATATWLEWNTQGATPHVPRVVTSHGWTGYIFGVGDADYTYYAVAIPCAAQQVMVEIGFESDDPTIELHVQRALEHSILATVRC